MRRREKGLKQKYARYLASVPFFYVHVYIYLFPLKTVTVQVQIRNNDARRRLLAWSEPEGSSDIYVEHAERLGPYLRGSSDYDGDDCDDYGDFFYEEDEERYMDKSGDGVGSSEEGNGRARAEQEEGAEEDIGVIGRHTVEVEVGRSDGAKGGVHVIGEQLLEGDSESEHVHVLSSSSEAARTTSGLADRSGSPRFWRWIWSDGLDIRSDDGKQRPTGGDGSQGRNGKASLRDNSDGQGENSEERRRGNLRDGEESGGHTRAVSKLDDVGRKRRRGCSRHRRRGNEGRSVGSRGRSLYHVADDGGAGDNAMAGMESDGGYGGEAGGEFQPEIGSSDAEFYFLEGESCTVN